MMRTISLWMIVFSVLALSAEAQARCNRTCESRKNRAAAEAYCDQYRVDNPEASCVVDKRVCPQGYVAAKKWRGRGTNYSACVKGKKGKKIKQKIAQVVYSQTAKVNLYKAYFKRVSKHKKLRQPLPEWFIARYSKYFKVNLRSIRVAESSKVNGSNAMTDCMNIYFPTDRLSDVVSSESSVHHRRWLLHEVAHAEQCHNKGSREAYARLWWRHLHVGILKAMAGGDGVKSDEIHDKNPMEKSAEAKAQRLKDAS